MTGNIFYWSDLHLSHSFVAQLRGFQDSQAHDEWVANQWASVVRRNDTVYVLGDVSSGSPQPTARALQLLQTLPGHKRLIAGNHDAVHPMHRTSISRRRPWADVFEEISPFGVRKIAGRKVLMSHFPYLRGGDHTERERYSQYRLPDEGLPLLCGHVHTAWAIRGSQLNVGVDWWDTPIPQNKIEAGLEGFG